MAHRKYQKVARTGECDRHSWDNKKDAVDWRSNHQPTAGSPTRKHLEDDRNE